MAEPQPALARTMGWKMLALYGLGSMLGAGIYGLIGKAAGVTGSAVWLAFVIAMIAAALTGISYAALGSRYPRAGGAAYILERAYTQRWIGAVAGLCVAASGLTSMAAGSRVIADNIIALTGAALPQALIAIGVIAFLAGFVLRGLKESMILNAIATAVEAGGLILVIAVGARFWGQADLFDMPAQTGGEAALLLAQGAVLTFFSFLGFEDTLNVSEEVKDPARNVPLGIIAAMIAATAIYLGVSITAVSVADWRELKEAAAPLGLVMERAAPWFPALGFTLITIFAVANTALINFVMGSRLLYGMSRQRLLPPILDRIHPKSLVPHHAAYAVMIAVSLLILAGDIAQLAAATVLLLLGVFALMNVALIILKLRRGEPPGRFDPPLIIPALGALICLALLIARAATGDPRAPLLAAGVAALALALYFLMRRAGQTGYDQSGDETIS